MISNTGLPTHLIAKAQPKIGWAWMLDGRGARIRTGGLLLPKQARYRAAPHPVGPILSIRTGLMFRAVLTTLASQSRRATVLRHTPLDQF